MAYDIIHRVGVDATADKVFETLTSLEGNKAWWDSNATGDARKGGLLTFFKSHDMKVVEATPGERVKWKVIRGSKEWMDTEISFQLVRRDDQTFVLFKHAGWKEPVEFMHHCSTRWGIFLACSLKPLLETGEGRPTPHDVKVYVGE